MVALRRENARRTGWSPTSCRGGKTSRGRRRDRRTGRAMAGALRRDLRPRPVAGERRRPDLQRPGLGQQLYRRADPGRGDARVAGRHGRAAARAGAPPGAGGGLRYRAAPVPRCPPRGALPRHRLLGHGAGAGPGRASTGSPCRRWSWRRGSPTTGPASAPGDFDLVVLNSVVQYFPGVEYLVQVLAGGGRGGGSRRRRLRRRRAQPAAARGVPRLGADRTARRDRSPSRSWRRGCGGAVADEEELVIDPALFLALARRLPAIRRVRVLLKRGHHANELTRFRYDVILHVGNGETAEGEDALRSHAWDSLGEPGEPPGHGGSRGTRRLRHPQCPPRRRGGGSGAARRGWR